MFTHTTKEIWKNYNFPHPTSLFTRMPIKQDSYDYNDCAHSGEQSTPISPPGQNAEHFYSSRIDPQACLQPSENNCNSSFQGHPREHDDHSNLESIDQNSQHSSRYYLQSLNLPARREANRRQQRRRIASETPERRLARLEAQRIQQQLRLASETPEQRAARLLALRERQKFRLAHETSEQRAARLSALRHRQRLRLASETPDQRARRLEALRIRQRQRIANESSDQRALRLADLRQRQRLRLANEAPEKRAQRLEALRIRQQARLAHETADQRVSRLAAARVRQQHRLASETREERAARFAGIKRRRRSSCSSVSTCPSLYIPRKLPPTSPPTTPPIPPPPPPPTPFHTPPSPHLTNLNQRQIQRQPPRRPVNMADATASDYWWESHFLVPAIQHQQNNLPPPPTSHHQPHTQHQPTSTTHPPSITSQPGHRTPSEFVNPMHIAWDSMYSLCTNNSDSNLANHSAALFAPFCNIRRAIPPHNQPAPPPPVPPLPTPPPHSPFNHDDANKLTNHTTTSPNPPRPQ